MSENTHLTDSQEVRASGTDLPTVLLSVYECLTNPDHFVDMSGMLTSWLETEDTPVLVASFEEHSAAVFRTLYEEFVEFQSSGPAALPKPTLDLHVPDGIPAASILETLSNALNTEDTSRLTHWLRDRSGREQAPLLVRYYATDTSSPKIGLFRDLDADRVGLFVTEGLFEDSVGRLFEQNFDLTRRELTVLKALVGGETPQQMAKSQNRSLETVRSQIKSITSKLGASSQTDVLRMAGEAMVLAPAPAAANKAVPLAVAGSRKLKRPDGRTVEYDIDPATRGLPLIGFHCLTSGRHWSAPALKAAKQAGFRPLRISRAGFAGSDVAQSVGLSLLQSHAEDCAAIMEAEGIARGILLAQGMGFPAAYQFALSHPDKVIGVIGINVPPPILSRADISVLKGIFKTGALSTLYAPSSAKLIASFAFRHLAKRRGVDPTKPISMPHIDITKYEDATGVAAFMQNSHDGLNHHGEGWWREATTATVDWAKARENANNRPLVRLIQSEDDPNVELDGIVQFAQRIGAPTRTIPSFLPQLAGPFPIIEEEIRSLRAQLGMGITLTES